MIKKMIFNSSLLGLLFLFSTASLLAQNKYSLETELSATGGIQEELPFWLHHNTRGRVAAGTNILGIATAKFEHEFVNHSLLVAGAGLLLRDHAPDEDYLDEAYISYYFDKFVITAGRKQRTELYDGLSATNENILWSLNSRPLPGISFGTTAPVMFLPSIGFEARWEEFLMEEDRHVPRARLHHKSLHLVVKPGRDWKIKAGIQHFAQWGGTSPEWGPQPEGFMDYLRIISGRQGGETSLAGDRANSLGNHLGSWELEVKKSFRTSTWKLIYNNIFEDGSGSRWANFPDGRYGIFWKKRDQVSFITSLLYEFYYTRHQSHNVNQWGADNYFGHGVYESSWTYYQQVIGAPFFTYDPEQELIVNNKFSAHHLGISGSLRMNYYLFPYKLLLSYAHNEGTYGTPIQPSNEDALYTSFSSRLYNSAYNDLQIDMQLGADFSNIKAPNFGAGISLKYHFSGQ